MRQEDMKAIAEYFLRDGGAPNRSFEIQSVRALGDHSAFGSFSDGNVTGLNIDQGLIFTTGLAKEARTE